ncbi:MAG TPA: DNA methyltransferase, partial [bacterium]|nr:DNA methyltransferase [bacterium]
MTTQQPPDDILRDMYKQATKSLDKSLIGNADIRERVEFVCRCLSNRAGVRLLMACLLGKIHNPDVDPRKPYTEIGGSDSFSGRTYDERYITQFINEHRLPCNSTTAFLTPTLRNINHPLTTDHELVGRPRDLYEKTLLLLEDVAKNRISPRVLFVETLRNLLQIRDENLSRIASLQRSLRHGEGSLP